MEPTPVVGRRFGGVEWSPGGVNTATDVSYIRVFQMFEGAAGDPFRKRHHQNKE